MSNSAENSKMQANNADADAAGGAALLLPPPVPAAPVAAAEAMTATASHSARQSHCDGSYICDCRLCICGGAVDYPGDVCYECSKYH